MKIGTVLCLSLFVTAAVAKDEADATADILKNLQDSGVMDSVKQELEKMLQDKDKMNELKDTILEKEKALRSKISEQLTTEKPSKTKEPLHKNADNEVLDYAVSYVQETGLKLSKELVQHVGKIPVQDAKKTLHFVQLSTTLDQLADAVSKGDIKEKEVLSAKFKSLKEVKDMVENMAKKKREESELAKEKEAPKKKDNQMSRAIRSFAAMAGNNPDMLVNAVLMGMASYNLASPDTIQMLRGYSHALTKIEGLGEGIQSLAENLAWLVESEEGETFFEIVPMLMEVDQREEAYEKLRVETRKQWSKFFAIINNTDMKRKFLVQVSEYLTAGYKMAVKDQMKMMVANAFLISQGLPTIMPKNLAESLIDLTDRSIGLFTTYKVDLKAYKPTVRKFIKQVEAEYVQVEQFDKLDDNEQAELVSQFFDDNVVSTAQEMFQGHDLVYSKNNLACAESILCAINEHARSYESNEIKVQLAHSLTSVLGWTWSTISEDEDADLKMQQAVDNGADSHKKCSQIYPNPACKIFEWQKENIMSLNYDHTEL